MAFVISSRGVAHHLAEDGLTECGREVEGEHVESVDEDTHVCVTCQVFVDAREYAETVEPEAPADDSPEPVGRSPKRHRRLLGY